MTEEDLSVRDKFLAWTDEPETKPFFATQEDFERERWYLAEVRRLRVAIAKHRDQSGYVTVSEQVAAEREACALVAIDEARDVRGVSEEYRRGCEDQAIDIAAAIRARGPQ